MYIQAGVTKMKLKIQDIKKNTSVSLRMSTKVKEELTNSGMSVQEFLDNCLNLCLTSDFRINLDRLNKALADSKED